MKIPKVCSNCIGPFLLSTKSGKGHFLAYIFNMRVKLAQTGEGGGRKLPSPYDNSIYAGVNFIPPVRGYEFGYCSRPNEYYFF